MKLTFWLLDINSKTSEEIVDLWLWGIDEKENRVLVIDHSFVDYFYVLIDEGNEWTKVAEEISKTKGLSIVKLEMAYRLFFGKPVQVIKVYCNRADEIPKLARILREIEGVRDCLEDDIRLSMRYVLDNDLTPCSWHEIDVVEQKISIGVRVDKVYTAISHPTPIEKVGIPSLRKLGFSMTCYSQVGMPNPKDDPIVILSTLKGNGENKEFVAKDDKNDKPVIEKFIETIQEYDPDIIYGFQTNARYWGYLRERCHVLGIKLDVDRAHTEPHTSVYGHVSLTGMVNIDLEDFMDQFPRIKVKTLPNLADYLKITAAWSSVSIEEMDFAEYWDAGEKRIELQRFTIETTRMVFDIADLLLDFAMQLSDLTGLPLDHVMTAAVGFRVDWFLIRYSQRTRELIPRRIERPYIPFAGGLVLEPQKGLHEHIVVLDFKSMYPHVMLRYNLSPDTYIKPGEPMPSEGFFEAPEVTHRFRKAPPGFYKEVLSYLIKTRDTIQERLKKLIPETTAYELLDSRQKAVKIITNAVYGYAGWIGARWYEKAVAEAASAWGRSIIRIAIDMAENEGLEVIYGDTDSLFVFNDNKKILHLEKEIEKKFNLHVESEESYERIFFTEAKKRYAGLRPDGSMNIVGFEVIRGDWAEVAKRVQEQVLRTILEKRPSFKAVEKVIKIVGELRNRKIPFRDLIIWKTLAKPVEEYNISASHVEAARILIEKGWPMSTGDKVGYVITRGEGRLYSRAKPYVIASYEEIDEDYYVAKQILPAAARVLEFFGVAEKDLFKAVQNDEKRTISLEKYLR